MIRPSIALLAVSFVLVSCAQQSTSLAGASTVRICDDKGCSDRPKDTATFDATRDDNPEETRRAAALTELAKKDPRAAYDLGLRYFRGDGIERNSYQAIQWMRRAGDRGNVQAQAALGRFYLMGLEEMGSDPQEAEKWLSLAAAAGDKESAKLVKEASAAKQRNQANYQAWVEERKRVWYGYWTTGYPYFWAWGGPRGWYYRY
jgi:uncharacterized protein